MPRRPTPHVVRCIITSAALLASMLGVPAAAQAAQVTLAAVADGYVSSGSPTTSWGSAPSMTTATRPTREAYLRFDVPAGATITSARLRLYVTDGSRTAPTAY